jgi:hypothetical protein
MSPSGTTRKKLTAGVMCAFVPSPDSAREAGYFAFVPLAEVTVFSRSPRCEAGQLIIEFLDQYASK